MHAMVPRRSVDDPGMVSAGVADGYVPIVPVLPPQFDLTTPRTPLRPAISTADLAHGPSVVGPWSASQCDLTCSLIASDVSGRSGSGPHREQRGTSFS